MCIRWAAYQITRSHNHPHPNRRDTLLKLVRRQFVVSPCSTAQTLFLTLIPTSSDRDEQQKLTAWGLSEQSTTRFYYITLNNSLKITSIFVFLIWAIFSFLF